MLRCASSDCRATSRLIIAASATSCTGVARSVPLLSVRGCRAVATKKKRGRSYGRKAPFPNAAETPKTSRTLVAHVRSVYANALGPPEEIKELNAAIDRRVDAAIDALALEGINGTLRKLYDRSARESGGVQPTWDFSSYAAHQVDQLARVVTSLRTLKKSNQPRAAGRPAEVKSAIEAAIGCGLSIRQLFDALVEEPRLLPSKMAFSSFYDAHKRTWKLVEEERRKRGVRSSKGEMTS